MHPVFRGGFESGDHFVSRPRPPTAHELRIDSSSAQSAIVAPEMSHRRGVKTRIIALDRTAVEGLIVHSSRAELERHGVAIPTPISADFIGIKSGGREGAVPSAEESRLE